MERINILRKFLQLISDSNPQIQESQWIVSRKDAEIYVETHHSDIAEYQRQQDLKSSQREKADGLFRDTNQNDCEFQQECKSKDVSQK